MDANGHLRTTDEDVVDGDVDELDNVANDAWHVSVMWLCCVGRVAQHTHDQETNANSLRDADELLLVRLCRGSVELFGMDARRVCILVQRFMKRVPSLRNSAGILRTC